MVKDKSNNKTSINEDINKNNQNTEQEEELIVEEVETDNVSEGDETDSDNSANLSDSGQVDWQDKYIRLSAEFDNYRKRTLKEKIDIIATGGEDVIKCILPILDDFDRAVDAVTKSDDIESARTGMNLIRQKLLDTMTQKGLSEIEAVGKDMDTDLFEAVANFPSEDQKGKIIDVVQKGYKLKDKVIRFSKVVVGE